MALDQSALTELLDALRSGGDLDFMREAMQLVLQALIELDATDKIGATRYERCRRSPFGSGSPLATRGSSSTPPGPEVRRTAEWAGQSTGSLRRPVPRNLHDLGLWPTKTLLTPFSAVSARVGYVN